MARTIHLGWLLGTVRGVYGNGDPASDPWVKVTGVPWEDEQVTALLRRWTVPYQLFVTTPDGVYVLFP